MLVSQRWRGCAAASSCPLRSRRVLPGARRRRLPGRQTRAPPPFRNAVSALSRRRCSFGGVRRLVWSSDQWPQDERACGEQQKGRDEQRHDAPTGLGTLAATGATTTRRSPALPRSTPRMTIPPPPPIEPTGGVTK